MFWIPELQTIPYATPWGLYVLSLVVVAHQEVSRGMFRLMADAMEERQTKQRDNTSKKKQERRKRRK